MAIGDGNMGLDVVEYFPHALVDSPSPFQALLEGLSPDPPKPIPVVWHLCSSEAS